MAAGYVRSADGNDADNGSTWALADATISGFAAGDAAGDVCYVSQAHAEAPATAQTWAFAGTSAAPTKVICGNDAAEPPTAVATTGAVTIGDAGLTVTGWCYVYGLVIACGNGSAGARVLQLGANGTEQVFEKCDLKMLSSGSGATISFGITGSAQPCRVRLLDVDVSIGAGGQCLDVSMGDLEWHGGSVLAGSSAATSGLIRNANGAGRHSIARVTGVDFTNIGVTGFLVGKVASSRVEMSFANCKLPAWTTGGLLTGTMQSGDRVSMYNCDSADPTTNVCRLSITDYFGTIVSDTTVYADDGVDDGGGVGYAWKMTTSADTEFPHQVLESDEIVRWNSTTGSAITVSVEIVHDGAAAMTDAEVWLEMMYLGTSGNPLATWTSDRCGNLNLNSDAAAQTAGSATWTGDTGTGPNGSTTWNQLKLSVASFTPQEKGFIHARVCMAVASKTIYIDPQIRVT